MTHRAGSHLPPVTRRATNDPRDRFHLRRRAKARLRFGAFGSCRSSWHLALARRARLETLHMRVVAMLNDLPRRELMRQADGVQVPGTEMKNTLSSA